MEIAVLNYSTATVDIYISLPDEWDCREIANYLYGELGLNEDETAFMIAQDIEIQYHKRK